MDFVWREVASPLTAAEMGSCGKKVKCELCLKQYEWGENTGEVGEDGPHSLGLLKWGENTGEVGEGGPCLLCAWGKSAAEVSLSATGLCVQASTDKLFLLCVNIIIGAHSAISLVL